MFLRHCNQVAQCPDDNVEFVPEKGKRRKEKKSNSWIVPMPEQVSNESVQIPMAAPAL